MRFLSDEWFEAAIGANPAPLSTGDRLKLGYIVTGGPEGDVEYRIVLPSGRIDRVIDETDVIFSMDYDTASSIHSGRENPQACVLDGRINLSGDPQRLIANTKDLEALPAVLAHLRGLSGA
jgi:hypothetical protein